jgi:RNA polymerase sigma factor (TIGR02999 family)
MRLILVDQVRRRTSLKAGGGAVPLSLDVLPLDPAVGESDLLAINDAIEALAKLDLRKVRVVELRFFGGLSVEETALALGVSTPTIKRDWALARSWLRREMARA